VVVRVETAFDSVDVIDSAQLAVVVVCLGAARAAAAADAPSSTLVDAALTRSTVVVQHAAAVVVVVLETRIVIETSTSPVEIVELRWASNGGALRFARIRVRGPTQCHVRWGGNALRVRRGGVEVAVSTAGDNEVVRFAARPGVEYVVEPAR